jgi:CAAX protease family protein
MSREQSRTVWPAAHGAVLAGALVIAAACLPPLVWPWYLLLPLLAYGVVVALTPPLRRSLPRLGPGRIDGRGAAAAVALSVLTAGVLLTYQALLRPDVEPLAAGLPVAAFGSVLLAGLCFSVLYDAVAAEWGATAAVGVTAVCFGLGHVSGYPPGPLGAVLAGLYGIALGLLRRRSGGLGLPVASHVCADATIFGILVSAGAFPDQAG